MLVLRSSSFSYYLILPVTLRPKPWSPIREKTTPMLPLICTSFHSAAAVFVGSWLSLLLLGVLLLESDLVVVVVVVAVVGEVAVLSLPKR